MIARYQIIQWLLCFDMSASTTMQSTGAMEAVASSSKPSASAASQEQVPLTLKTSIPELALPPTSYLVPTSFSRTHLSTLVNRLLEQTAGISATIPFDFIVNGELLRESLGFWLDKNGKTVEEGIELEYIKSTLPPKFSGAFESDDWIASVDASREGVFLTAGYDSAIRLYSYASPQEPLLTHKVASSGSSPASLIDARWVGTSSQIVTAGLDGSIRLFEMPEANPTPDVPGQTYTSQPRQLWFGQHTAQQTKGKATAAAAPHNMPPSALTSVHASQDGTAVISASRDGSVAYWKLDEIKFAAANGKDDDDDEAADEASRKRRKGANGKRAAASPTPASPTALLWHSQPTLSASSPAYIPASNSCVSRSIFAGSSSDRAFSAGHDGRVIEWDLFAATHGGNAKLTQKTSDKVILALDQLRPRHDDDATLITGHMDRSIGVWDMRSASANISLLLPNAHAAPIYSVSAHPTSSFLLASTSGDGVVKLFDTRSPRRALFSLTRPNASTEKLLASAWDNDGQVVLAGGEDCKVSVFRGQGIGRDAVEG